MIRPLSWLVPLYAAAAGAKNAAYNRGWMQPQRLAWPVVSIGNLSVGGSGKTPIVVRLAQLLSAENVSVDVLSRGYGRQSSAIEPVDPNGDASRYGDEPLLIARAAGVPVYVGASRWEAGLLAERAAPAPAQGGVHLLDDGFQHRKLARELDVVVLRADDLEDMLLPAGNLREPVSSLRRANIIVLRAEDRGLEAALRARGISAPIWIQHRELAVEPAPRALAFCGIAQPEEFFSALRAKGIELAATVAFRDHQSYTHTELDRLLKMLRREDARCFLTTEKDAVRLAPDQRSQLQRIAPLRIARLQVSLEDEPGVVRQIRSLLVRK